MSVVPDGYEPKPPFRFSYGEYVLQSGQYALPGRPLKLSTETETGTNKKVIVNYTDVSGVEPFCGITYKLRYPSGVVDNDRLGRGHFRRDLKLYLTVDGPLYYVRGTNPLPANSKIAPDPSGCQEWKPGMACMGYSITDATYTGTSNGIFAINAIATSDDLKVTGQDIKITSNVGSLASTPYAIDFAYGSGATSGYLSYDIIPSGYREASGQVSVNFGVTGADCIHTCKGDDVAKLYVRYWYY
jgi:hypothetical protein